jgi:glycosyltransferase involved in cell wall biosynthesis
MGGDLVVLTILVADTLTDEELRKLSLSARAETVSGRLKIRRAPSRLTVESTPSTGHTQWIAFVCAPIVFTRKGAHELVSMLGETGESEVLYFDSIDIDGKPVLRPIFSPERLRSHFYLGGLVLYRTSVFAKLKNLRGKWDVNSQYELALGAAELKISVTHLADRLYEAVVAEVPPLRGTEPWKDLQGILEGHMLRTGGGTVRWNEQRSSFETARAVIGSPLVSIVMPTRATRVPGQGRHDCVVLRAVHSIIERTEYSNFEIVLVVDTVADDEVLDELTEIAGSKLRIIRWNHPFNFSQKMNYGVLHSRGEFVLLLNDDVEVLSVGWLESMLGLAQLPNAGMVGAMLFYEDETIQHAGHAYFKGSPTHIGLGLKRGAVGPQNSFLVDREVSGVTAACAMMPRGVFDEVGGFTALLPGNFNDVDLCLKVGWKKFDIYWTPRAELYHFESKTRDAHVHYYELDVIGHRWGLRLDDPRYWPALPWATT